MAKYIVKLFSVVKLLFPDYGYPLQQISVWMIWVNSAFYQAATEPHWSGTAWVPHPASTWLDCVIYPSKFIQRGMLLAKVHVPGSWEVKFLKHERELCFFSCKQWYWIRWIQNTSEPFQNEKYFHCLTDLFWKCLFSGMFWNFLC